MLFLYIVLFSVGTIIFFRSVLLKSRLVLVIYIISFGFVQQLFDSSCVLTIYDFFFLLFFLSSAPASSQFCFFLLLFFLQICWRYLVWSMKLSNGFCFKWDIEINNCGCSSFLLFLSLAKDWSLESWYFALAANIELLTLALRSHYRNVFRRHLNICEFHMMSYLN